MMKADLLSFLGTGHRLNVHQPVVRFQALEPPSSYTVQYSQVFSGWDIHYINMYVIYMIVDQKVHVRAFNCESLQGSKMRRRESFFSEFAKETFFFFAKVSRK